MSRAVLDTSAVLALCFAEAGAHFVLARGKRGVVSAVSYSEAMAKCVDLGMPLDVVQRALAGLYLEIIPFDQKHGLVAASFRAATRSLSFSFAERACLATAALANLPVLTAERKWKDVETGLEILLVR